LAAGAAYCAYFFVNLISMTELKIMEKKGTEAVRKLRLQKLKTGYPFMINSKELLSNQCYLEYPDGVIKLVTFTKAARDFNVIRELSNIEANTLRSRYKFYI
jgi:hypothetical protein